MTEEKIEYECDQWLGIRRRRCKRKPHCEVFVTNKRIWAYLCRRHYILDRLYCKLFRVKTHGYCILDKDATRDRFE